MIHIRRIKRFEAGRTHFQSMDIWIMRARLHTLENVCVCVHVHFPLCTVDDSKTRSSVVSKWACESGSIIKMHGGEFPTVLFIWGASLRQSQQALLMADAAVPGIIKGWGSDRWGNPDDGLAQPATTANKSAEEMVTPIQNLGLVLSQSQNIDFDTNCKFHT